jgi:hypothetical protein
MQTWQMQNKSHVQFTAIVMLFLRAKVIPVNPQIHANVMLIFLFIFF